MTQSAKENGQLVTPGEKLGVIEEFMPGEGTFEEQGNIYSNTVGNTRFDFLNKTAAVERIGHKPVVPEDKTIIVGMVTRAQKSIAQVEISSIGKRRLSIPFAGILHISSSSPRYERSMKDVCKTGDIIRAMITNAKSVIPQLTTVGRELGVIKASCSRCGQTLFVRDRGLRCDACGNVEYRKMAEDYGKDLN
ncbi:MAG: exosome complex RNA-binding protein Csl4 [archaeon]